jgi:RNA polymerase sigma-70 factor (ECF subfamily)
MADLYEACISKIANGDKDALGLLYEQSKDAVYGFALSILQNAHEAEDVLQDTFVSVYASARSYKSMGKPMAWILTTTRNLSLMKLRQRQKTADLSEDEWSLFIAESTAVSSEDKLLLTAALQTITPEESQIVMLHAVAGFKHREIAGVLELPLSTVLSRYSRAIKKLKSTLEEAGAHEE